MSVLITPGPIRLAVLNSIGGTKLKTLWLPIPDRKSPELEWVPKETNMDLVDGSERTRRLGFIPVLRVKWSPYDDRAVFGRTIGIAEGNKPSLEQLLPILSMAPGFLKVSLGDGATPYGFVVGRVDVDKMAYRSSTFTDLSVTFRGRDIVADRTLGAF
jgi:hypothetical protein